MDALKKIAADAAMNYLRNKEFIGVGTGSTVNFFIDKLAQSNLDFEACVASSIQTESRLRSLNIPIVSLNAIHELPVYIDGADEINRHGQMIKGGGGALTREKIIGSMAKQFICIADEHKFKPVLGDFPIAVEVIPMARSYVARELLKLGGDPVYRENVTTDNGNIILDFYHADLIEPKILEDKINQIAGVVENGIFANRTADIIFLGKKDGVEIINL